MGCIFSIIIELTVIYGDFIDLGLPHNFLFSLEPFASLGLYTSTRLPWSCCHGGSSIFKFRSEVGGRTVFISGYSCTNVIATGSPVPCGSWNDNSGSNLLRPGIGLFVIRLKNT